MPANRVTRRTFAATAGGVAAGVFAAPLRAATAWESAVAGQATPVAAMPVGYVSTRLRTLSSPEFRADVNERVIDQLVPEVEVLDGYQGYILGDVVDRDDQNVAISVMESIDRQAAFDAAAREFVAGLGELSAGLGTREWAGDLVIAEGPVASAATPVAMGAGGFVTVRAYVSAPGTDPREFVPLLISGFLPITTGIPGFEGYLWYLTEDGFVAISLFDSIASADASTEAAREWAAENVARYIDGDPIVVNADVVYADLPILG